MNNLIISPHTDDAIFSLGDFIPSLGNVTILAPFAGIPEDPKGRRKHLILREEHVSACYLIGANIINGPFLDDVYPPSDYREVVKWLTEAIRGYDMFYVPLGIYHKDHVLIRQIFMMEFKVDYFYAELPYRIAFPEIADEAVTRYAHGRILITSKTGLKKEAVLKYQSQNGGPVMEQVMVEERIYE